MKIARIYLDTAVLGGCFDPEFASWSNGLIEDFRAGLFVPVLSELLAAEIEPAPVRVRAVYEELRAMAADLVPVNAEVDGLVRAYTAQGILGTKFVADMAHIALATVAGADVLVSWNFRHIVRFDKIRLFNAVNLGQGYHPLAIHSPRSVTIHGRDADPRR